MDVGLLVCLPDGPALDEEKEEASGAAEGRTGEGAGRDRSLATVLLLLPLMLMPVDAALANELVAGRPATKLLLLVLVVTGEGARGREGGAAEAEEALSDDETPPGAPAECSCSRSCLMRSVRWRDLPAMDDEEAALLVGCSSRRDGVRGRAPLPVLRGDEPWRSSDEEEEPSAAALGEPWAGPDASPSTRAATSCCCALLSVGGRAGGWSPASSLARLMRMCCCACVDRW